MRKTAIHATAVPKKPATQPTARTVVVHQIRANGVVHTCKGSPSTSVRHVTPQELADQRPVSTPTNGWPCRSGATLAGR